MKLLQFPLCLCLFVCQPLDMKAQPVMNKKEQINSIDIFPDLKNKSLFYIAPGNLGIGTDNFGKPQLKFIQMRYSGSQATGDQGVINFKSILQFTIRMKNPDGNTIREIKTILSNRVKSSIELKPLPIRNMDASLIYAAIDPQENNKSKIYSINGGNFENSDDEAKIGSEGEYWTERTFTLKLDNASSQLFWNALEKNQSMMSLSFNYYVEGVSPLPPMISINVSAEIAEEVKRQISNSASVNANVIVKTKEAPETISNRKNYSDSLQKELTSRLGAEFKSDSSLKTTLFKADAFTIGIDAKKYPELIKKVDINAAFIPPDFAVMDVRCYDFNNDLRKDLYAKRIEIEATGMNGKPVMKKASFYNSSADVTYAGIRFNYAVKMNLPYRYRIVEITRDTDPIYSNWITEKNWNKIIDITTKK